MRSRPTLILISGPGGAGKTTLAHVLARTISCPVISRDEIKEGMVHATPDFTASPGDELTRRTFPVFFDALGLLLRAGVTVIGEAAFVGSVWRPQLARLVRPAMLRVIRCHTEFEARLARRRGRVRTAHADAQTLADRGQPEDCFEYLDMECPTIDVDTTSEYQPSLATIVAFINTKQ